MAITQLHDVHKRRKSRNVGLGLSLGAFVILVMVLTIIKIPTSDEMAARVATEVSE